MLIFEGAFMTSGATKPGVPHLLNKYSGISYTVARPKSTIFKTAFSSLS